MLVIRHWKTSHSPTNSNTARNDEADAPFQIVEAPAETINRAPDETDRDASEPEAMQEAPIDVANLHEHVQTT